jgi:two-component system, NarL family, sensor histidine kinase NreB
MRARLAVGSLRTRLMLSVALASMPIAAVIVLTGRSWRQHEIADALATALQICRQAAAVHSRALRHAHQSIGTVAAAVPPIGRPMNEPFQPVVEDALEHQTPFANAGVVGVDGRISYVARRLDPGGQSRVQAAFQSAAAAAWAETDFDVDPVSGRLSALLFTPVREAQGAVFATVDLPWLDDGSSLGLLPSGTAITVFDRRGRLLARLPRAADAASRDPHPVVVRAALESAEPGSDATERGSRIHAYAPLYGSTRSDTLYMVVSIVPGAATAEADRLLRWISVAVLISLVFAGALAWMTGEQLSRDVDALVGSANRLIGGDVRQSRIRDAPVSRDLSPLSTAIGNIADTITRREQALVRRHDELAVDDRRLRAVIETAVGRVVIFDVDGTILYASPSSVRMAGYHVDAIVGRRRFDLVHTDDRDTLRARFDEIVRTPGGAFTATFRFRTQNAWRWIECEISNMLLEPRVRAMVGKFRDVTEMREAEDERRRMQAELELHVRERTAALSSANQALHRLSRAIEQTADSVFVTNRDGVIEYVNPAFEEMTGYTSDEVLGHTPRMLSSGVHDQKYYTHLWETIMSGKVFRAVVTNKRKDGRLFNEDQSITPVRDTDGVITHFVSTGRDITERKRIEAAVRRLNAALEDESARIASVLHDEAGQFLSSAHITLADVARELAPEQRSRVQQVRHHLDLAEEQLRRVSHELHPRILDDLGLAEAIRFLATGFARRAGISVDVDVSIGSFCPRSVETVFYRLVQEGLTNIGKHARATSVSIRLAHEVTRITCSISDDGAGFDVASVVEERDGFSLGLTLMRDRIEAVGGSLTILSGPQRGTELRATVPVED